MIKKLTNTESFIHISFLVHVYMTNTCAMAQHGNSGASLDGHCPHTLDHSWTATGNYQINQRFTVFISQNSLDIFTPFEHTDRRSW